jgi:hypothetical protein
LSQAALSPNKAASIRILAARSLSKLGFAMLPFQLPAFQDLSTERSPFPNCDSLLPILAIFNDSAKSSKVWISPSGS